MSLIDEQVDAQRQLDFVWRRTLSIIPRRCELSDDRIRMFSYAYKGVRETRIPHVTWRFTAWASTERYMFEKIKGTVR